MLDFPSKEFFEPEKLGQTIPKSRKGGRYPDHITEKRREEVYRLHFDYGYSGRKIAQLMKVNRHTIEADIKYHYGKITKKESCFDVESWVTAKIEQLEIQRSRIRQRLDNDDEFTHIISLERMLIDLDNKIIQIRMKLIDSTVRHYENDEAQLNEWLENHGEKKKVFSLGRFLNVSEKNYEKIVKILKQERNLGKWIR